MVAKATSFMANKAAIELNQEDAQQLVIFLHDVDDAIAKVGVLHPPFVVKLLPSLHGARHGGQKKAPAEF